MILFSNGKVLLAKEELEDFSVIDTTSFDGATKWVDKDGRCHREDGPAYISCDGKTKYWFNHGKLHRTDGPAIDSPYGKSWLINGLAHREDGPSYIDGEDGSEVYCLNDKEVTRSAVLALGKMK